ncbi:MAG: N-acetyl-gamma-glutamyl-phosphate reductase, partial [Halobacteria archaeon]
MKKVGIIGGSGYTGGELIRLLMMHPKVEIVAITSKKFKDKPVHAVHSFLKAFSNLRFSDHAIEAVADADLVFTAVPHGTAMDYVPQLLDVGLKVVDLSADYRLSVEEFEKIYG